MLARIEGDLKTAMKSGEKRRVSTLRFLLAALKNEKIQLQRELTGEEVESALRRSVKQRKDSIEQFEKGGRPELAKREADEIVIIEAYMPKAVGEQEIVAAVEATILEMGSPTMKDMGAVMKNVMAKFGGARVDGKLVSEAVKKQLATSN